jgi:Flp pilus assembly protein TadG
LPQRKINVYPLIPEGALPEPIDWQTEYIMRNLARLSRRCARAIIRFGVAQRGVTAVEFALVAPLLIGLLVAIFQVTFFLFAQMNLQNAAVSVGRLIMTGQVQNAGTSQANFLTNDVCPLLGPMFTCSKVYANVQSYTNFSGASTTAPTLTYNGSGAVNNTWAYSLGNSGQVMVVQLIYQWPIISGPLHAVLPSISGNTGYAEMMGISAFRIEPYQQ